MKKKGKKKALTRQMKKQIVTNETSGLRSATAIIDSNKGGIRSDLHLAVILHDIIGLHLSAG